MKGYIFHGENVVESRKKLIEWEERARQKGWDLVRFEGINLKKNELLEALCFQNLFFKKQLFVIENFFSSGKNATYEAIKIGTKLTTGDQVIIFWEGDLIDREKIKKLAQYFTIQEFRLSPSIFKFLYSLSPNNTKQVMEFFTKARKENPEELILAMMARHIILLLWAKLDPESLSLPSWQQNKLKKQARLFSEEELKRLVAQLLSIDRMQKTAKTSEDLILPLDLVLLSI
jgi:DNA polymerase III delta subunit